MRIRAIAFSTVFLAWFGTSVLAEEVPDIKVLYAGNPDTPRTTDFESFLKRYFRQVAVTNLKGFRESEAKDHDVVIFDWTSAYDGKGGIDETKPPAELSALSEEFDRPAILIGGAGVGIAGAQKLKINWL